MLDPFEEYARRYGVEFVDKLGDGKDGLVLKTGGGQAVKFLRDADGYTRELRAYRVLRHGNLDEIGGHQIPRLVRRDDELHAIEMTIVAPPYLLDFAAAYNAAEIERLAFTREVMEEREQYWAEIFGEHWAPVVSLRNEFLRRTGLTLLDLSLNNIRFE